MVSGARSAPRVQMLLHSCRYLVLWMHHLRNTGSKTALPRQFHARPNRKDLPFHWIPLRRRCGLAVIRSLKINDKINKSHLDQQIHQLPQRFLSRLRRPARKDNRLQPRKKDENLGDTESLSREGISQA